MPARVLRRTLVVSEIIRDVQLLPLAISFDRVPISDELHLTYEGFVIQLVGAALLHAGYFLTTGVCVTRQRNLTTFFSTWATFPVRVVRAEVEYHLVRQGRIPVVRLIAEDLDVPIVNSTRPLAPRCLDTSQNQESKPVIGAWACYGSYGSVQIRTYETQIRRVSR